MERRLLCGGISFLFVIFITGCSSTAKKQDLEIQGLRNQVSVLEAKAQSRDQEIESLREALNKTTEEKAAPGGLEVAAKIEQKVSAEVNIHPPSIKEIQTALKNAGFYRGSIDGKLGTKSREAIQAFQKANNLKVDGKVGGQTWAVLKSYLGK